MIFSRHFYVISVIFFALSSSAVADLVLPSDLNPGDQYRLVFVSDASTAASSSDITFYNQFVNSAANAPTTDTAPLSLSWTAIASTDSIDAQDNTGTNPTVSSGVPIYRLDGVRIADDYVDLWKATIQNPIRVTESGTTITNSGVWTGSATDGTADSLYPLDGTGELRFGQAAFTNNNWITSGRNTAPQQFRLYGLSEALTISVPEPSAFLFLGLAVVLAQLAKVTRYLTNAA